MSTFAEIRANDPSVAMVCNKTPMALSNSEKSFGVGHATSKIMTNVTLPDGSVKELPVVVQTTMYVSKDIALAAGVNMADELAKLNERRKLKADAKGGL